MLLSLGRLALTGMLCCKFAMVEEDVNVALRSMKGSLSDSRLLPGTIRPLVNCVWSLSPMFPMVIALSSVPIR